MWYGANLPPFFDPAPVISRGTINNNKKNYMGYTEAESVKDNQDAIPNPIEVENPIKEVVNNAAFYSQPRDTT